MSLNSIVANKKSPCYRCTCSVNETTKILGSAVCGTFHIGWEYQLNYVENRVPKSLISRFFNKIEN